MDYVSHTCRKCKCAFIAEDYTKVTEVSPVWRYCKSCCEQLGIDYDKQTPKTNRTPQQQKLIDERTERLKEFRFKSKQGDK